MPSPNLPDVRVGDWVRSGPLVHEVKRPSEANLYSMGGLSGWIADEIRGTRDGQPYHWRRDDGQ